MIDGRQLFKAMGKVKRKANTKQCCSLRTAVFGVLVLSTICMIAYEIVILHTMEHGPDVSPYSRTLVAQLSMDTKVDAMSVLSELSGFKETNIEDVGKEKIVNSVHFVWCENKTFTFANYLSVISVWKNLRPDIIEFHQTVPPLYDKYDDWFEDLRATIPSLSVQELPSNWDGEEMGCGVFFGLAVIDDRGGIYVGNNIIVSDDISVYLRDDMTLIFDKSASHPEANLAVAMAHDHDKDFKQFMRAYAKSKTVPEQIKFCGNIDKELKLNVNASCYVIDTDITPRDIFDLDSPFGSLARRLVYGSEELKRPTPVLPGTIPKIVHYVWFGVREMDFMMYLSILSALYIVNPDKVFIHGEGGLTGKYFTKIRHDKRVVLIKRERPFEVYGHKLLYTQHRSDIVRAEVLLKYGGIYMDWDVLWLKSPDELIQTGYDTIANFDHMQKEKFPETINLGVLMAKPKSTFIKRWQDALRNYKTDDFLYNAVELPYKVYEKYPEYLYIERHLQVMCFHLKCHPTFKENYKDFINEQAFDWRTEAYAIHFTYPDPEELTDEKKCRNGVGRFADICHHILKHEHKIPLTVS
ncbi:uncharacterized protein LOC127848540 isoform X2 [Dreissena polymorpha]|uniref:Uncharacterized protein n=2 Tax=Dreissena polymorpha TaxID=45954 RepID=A0A9D4IA77_DREPO|nr:uncharacterized protein LOC127848540 isoform X2 [Dreissena polymorpha]KAH3753969.1 hypothetical protein DPMN_188625 [Dreissena polymorpha]